MELWSWWIIILPGILLEQLFLRRVLTDSWKWIQFILEIFLYLFLIRKPFLRYDWGKKSKSQWENHFSKWPHLWNSVCGSEGFQLHWVNPPGVCNPSDVGHLWLCLLKSQMFMSVTVTSGAALLSGKTVIACKACKFWLCITAALKCKRCYTTSIVPRTIAFPLVVAVEYRDLLKKCVCLVV